MLELLYKILFVLSLKSPMFIVLFYIFQINIPFFLLLTFFLCNHNYSYAFHSNHIHLLLFLLELQQQYSYREYLLLQSPHNRIIQLFPIVTFGIIIEFIPICTLLPIFICPNISAFSNNFIFLRVHTPPS